MKLLLKNIVFILLQIVIFTPKLIQAAEMEIESKGRAFWKINSKENVDEYKRRIIKENHGNTQRLSIPSFSDPNSLLMEADNEGQVFFSGLLEQDVKAVIGHRTIQDLLEKRRLQYGEQFTLVFRSFYTVSLTIIFLPTNNIGGNGISLWTFQCPFCDSYRYSLTSRAMLKCNIKNAYKSLKCKGRKTIVGDAELKKICEREIVEPEKEIKCFLKINGKKDCINRNQLGAFSSSGVEICIVDNPAL